MVIEIFFCDVDKRIVDIESDIGSVGDSDAESEKQSAMDSAWTRGNESVFVAQIAVSVKFFNAVVWIDSKNPDFLSGETVIDIVVKKNELEEMINKILRIHCV